MSENECGCDDKNTKLRVKKKNSFRQMPILKAEKHSLQAITSLEVWYLPGPREWNTIPKVMILLYKRTLTLWNLNN